MVPTHSTHRDAPCVAPCMIYIAKMIRSLLWGDCFENKNVCSSFYFAQELRLVTEKGSGRWEAPATVQCLKP